MSDVPQTAMEWALFLDFDGTLVDLAPTPDGVHVPDGLHGTLAALGARLSGAVALVTGRDLASLDRVLGRVPVDVCALHGLEWRRGDRVLRPDLPSLAAEVDRLRRQFGDRPGVLVEDKGVGLALHWRGDPDGEAPARAAVAALADRLGPPYRVQDGKAVCELVPGHAGKGDGIRALMRDPPFRGRRPCFIGDDRTDEHGFRAVDEADGVSVKVGPGPTCAGRRVGSVSVLAGILSRWAEAGPDPLALPRTEPDGN